MFGNFVRGVTCLLQFFVQDYWQFFITEFIGALGVAMWATSSSVVMADLTNVDNRGRLLALRSITTRLGVIAGPGVRCGNNRPVSRQHPLCLPVQRRNQDLHPRPDLLPREGDRAELNRRGVETQQQGKLDLSFFMTRAFMALMITSFSLNMMGQTGAFGALFPVQAKDDVGLSASEVGALISLAGVVGLLVAYPNGWAVDRWGRKPTLIPGLLLLAGAAFVLANMHSIEQAYLMIGLYGLGSTISMGASQAFAVDLAPPDRRGSFLGVWTLIGSLGSIFRTVADRCNRGQPGLRPRLRSCGRLDSWPARSSWSFLGRRPERRERGRSKRWQSRSRGQVA